MLTRPHGNSRGPPEQAPAPHDSDFRLLPSSPRIDAGENLPWGIGGMEIVGRRRLICGGKSLNTDMGAYEFYINKPEPIPGTDQAVLTWSSLAGKTYSIFYTNDLLTWHLIVGNFPSNGNTTTFWTDDGSLTAVPPSVVPRRFYRVLENP